jgi:hypothetical protein
MFTTTYVPTTGWRWAAATFSNGFSLSPAQPSNATAQPYCCLSCGSTSGMEKTHEDHMVLGTMPARLPVESWKDWVTTSQLTMQQLGSVACMMVSCLRHGLLLTPTQSQCSSCPHHISTYYQSTTSCPVSSLKNLKRRSGSWEEINAMGLKSCPQPDALGEGLRDTWSTLWYSAVHWRTVGRRLLAEDTTLLPNGGRTLEAEVRYPKGHRCTDEREVFQVLHG